MTVPSSSLDWFDTFPELKSPRLKMSALSEEHVPMIYEMRQNHRVNRFTTEDLPNSLDSAKDYVEHVNDRFLRKEQLMWAGELSASGDFIGTSGFLNFDLQHGCAEFGGEMMPPFWGKNIAMEAMQAILNYGFQVIGLNRIETRVHPGNRGGIYLLEAAGFKKEGVLRQAQKGKDGFTDIFLYGLLEGELRGFES